MNNQCCTKCMPGNPKWMACINPSCPDCHQPEKPAPEGWELKTGVDDAAKKIMKITEVNDWPEGDLMEIDVRDVLKKLLAAQKKEIVEDGMYHQQGKACCYLNPCGCVCHEAQEKI